VVRLHLRLKLLADVGLVVNRECSADQRVDLTPEPASSVC